MWRNTHANGFGYEICEADLTDENIVDLVSDIQHESRFDQSYDSVNMATSDASHYLGASGISHFQSSSHTESTQPPFPSTSGYLGGISGYSATEGFAPTAPHGFSDRREDSPDTATATSEFENWNTNRPSSDKENYTDYPNKRKRNGLRRDSHSETIMNLGRQLASITVENDILQRQNAILERDAEALTRQLKTFKKQFGITTVPDYSASSQENIILR